MSKKIRVFFNKSMLKENKSFSPSAFKPSLVVEDWQRLFSNYVINVDFPPISKESLFLVHDKQYVEDIFTGNKENGFGVKDKDFSSTFLYTNASLYYAACDALINNIAVSPTSGFHHARYDRSEGFCTFNGLVLTAKMLKENNLAQKIGILDFDMHYGNGTEEIIKKHNIDYIVHYTAGKYYDLHYPILNIFKPVIKYFYNKIFTAKNKMQTPQPKLRQKILKNKGNEFINDIPSILQKFIDCDIIIYQAGADQHINDPYGGLLTYEQMKTRDKLVFEFAKNNDIPLVWNLAGGYQKDIQGTIEPVLKCHRNTMEVCVNTYLK